MNEKQKRVFIRPWDLGLASPFCNEISVGFEKEKERSAGGRKEGRRKESREEKDKRVDEED